MQLSGSDYRAIHDAFCDAFPSVDDLRRFVQIALDVPPRRLIAPGVALPAVVDRLLEWAQAAERVDEAVRKAKLFNPGNTLLQALPDQFAHVVNAAGEAVDRSLAQALTHYLQWVYDTYKRPELRGLEEMDSKVQRLTLADIYVSLTVTLDAADEQDTDPHEHARQQSDANEPIDMAELLAQSNRIAITGAPGCGKTTFLKVIATALAEAHLSSDRALVARYLGLDAPLPVPIFVTLGDYNRHRRDHPADNTIRAWLNQQLQKKVRGVPADFFDRLLDGPTPVIVLLDGLDEVADETERELVSDQVATLINGSRVDYAVVTSRTRAYRGRVRLPDLRIAAVRPMAPEQVRQLAARWCAGVYPTADEQQARTASLIDEIGKLEAHRERRNEQPLVDTPLMVTIVAIVHYKNTRLPDQRAALYAKCVTILLEDLHHMPTDGAVELRDLGGSPDVQRQMLALLAFRMMTAGEQAGRTIDQRTLEGRLKPAFESEYGAAQARDQLRAFTAALRSRASLIKEEDGNYSFVHLTFQEFLAAYHLAETVRATDDILDELLADERAADAWWRETILLLIGHIGVSSKPVAVGLIERLAAVGGSDELQLAAAELATTAFIELESRNQNVRDKLHDRLVDLLTTPGRTLQPTTRLRAGDALAALGDNRPGVCTTIVRNGITLPDIAWGKQVKAGQYTIGGDGQAWRSFGRMQVKIAKPFSLSRYPVTYSHFQCFLAAPDHDHNDWWKGMPDDARNFREQRWPISNRPRENVSWYQAVAFCRWLAHHLEADIDLPSEYEWEVAARYAGNGRSDDRVYPWGSDPITPDHANYDDTKLGETSVVGVFPAGRQTVLQLDDLVGNIFEWCLNKYGVTDATGVDKSNGSRSVRGGSWVHGHGLARAASRFDVHPHGRGNNVGLRLVVRRPPSHGH